LSTNPATFRHFHVQPKSVRRCRLSSSPCCLSPPAPPYHSPQPASDARSHLFFLTTSRSMLTHSLTTIPFFYNRFNSLTLLFSHTTPTSGLGPGQTHSFGELVAFPMVCSLFFASPLVRPRLNRFLTRPSEGKFFPPLAPKCVWNPPESRLPPPSSPF